MPGAPLSSGPRATLKVCLWASSPCVGQATVVWQFMQRGWFNTFTIVWNAAIEALSSPVAARLVGDWNQVNAKAHASALTIINARIDPPGRFACRLKCAGLATVMQVSRG